MDTGPHLHEVTLDAAELHQGACASCGCNDPRCPLVLNARCHPARGVRVTVENGLLRIACAICSRHVVSIVLPPDATPTLTPPCRHVAGPVEVKYFKLATTLEITCDRCHKAAPAISLAEEAPSGGEPRAASGSRSC
jgi:hypothetical protein